MAEIAPTIPHIAVAFPFLVSLLVGALISLDGDLLAS
jgi:hypothetical protein